MDVGKWTKTIFAFNSDSLQVIDSIDLSRTLQSVRIDFETRMVQCLDSLFCAKNIGALLD